MIVYKLGTLAKKVCKIHVGEKETFMITSDLIDFLFSFLINFSLWDGSYKYFDYSILYIYK